MRSSCGSVSWQIFEGGEDGNLKPTTGDEDEVKGRRLNIAYYTNYR